MNQNTKANAPSNAALVSTGIRLRHQQNALWSATVEFSNLLHANPKCISGSIGPEYILPLSVAIDRAICAAESIGITFKSPILYVEDDGESPAVANYPHNWRDLIHAESDRLGWEFIYGQNQPKVTPKNPGL